MNDRGFAKIFLLINQPSLNELGFFGLIKIRAFLDNEGFEDVAEGLLVLKIKNFKKTSSILIHPNKDLVEKK